MELMNWIWAVVALSSGLLLGELAGRLARSLAGRGGERAPAAAGDSVGKVVFWTSTLIGLVLATSALSPATLERFMTRLGDQVPRLLLAAVWLIVGYATAALVAAMVGQSALKATGVRQIALERTLRVVIMIGAVAAALNQAGVAPAIIAVIVSVGLIVPSATIVLLMTQGGRPVASQIAAGRVVGQHVQVGDEISSMGHQGTVVAVHPTSIELGSISGPTVHIPNSQLLEYGFEKSTDVRSTRGPRSTETASRR